MRATAGPSGAHTLDGTASFVVDGGSAGKFVVAALLDGKRRYLLVERDATGLEVELLAWRDITREVATLRFAAVVAELLDGTDEDCWPTVRDRMTFLLAAESHGGMTQSLDDAVAYAKERRAFGKPIGAFQAIKHYSADLKGGSRRPAPQCCMRRGASRTSPTLPR